MKHLYIFLIFVIFITGCATSGKKIDQETVSRITIGETTKAEVIEWMGQPQSVARLGNGDTILTYMYAKSTAKAENFIPVVGIFAGGSNTESETTMVTFGTDDVVKDISTTQSSTDMNTGIASGQ